MILVVGWELGSLHVDLLTKVEGRQNRQKLGGKVVSGDIHVHIEVTGDRNS